MGGALPASFEVHSAAVAVTVAAVAVDGEEAVWEPFEADGDEAREEDVDDEDEEDVLKCFPTAECLDVAREVCASAISTANVVAFRGSQ